MPTEHRKAQYPREAFDTDLTFSITLRMGHIRHLAELVIGRVMDTDHHSEPFAREVYAACEGIKLLADQGDFIAEYVADELNTLMRRPAPPNPEQGT